MSEAATAPKSESRGVPVPTAVPGATWFGAMVAVWSSFVTLLAASPETLDDAYEWLTGLAIVWEVLMWIVLLPWALAYLVWDSSWEHWVRVLVVVIMAVVHLSISVPRERR
jgi:hypothetical protein